MASKRVLVVDDDDYWRGEIAAVVNDLGYEAVRAEDAQTATELLPGGNFDLLITDNWMGAYNAGLELLARNQLEGIEIPSILHTTSLSTVQRVRLAQTLPDVIPVVKSTTFEGGRLVHPKLREAIQQLLA